MAQVLKPAVRARILAAGGQVFSDHGYEDATMVDIARCAGVATANIYRYFPDKAALFEAVIPDELIAEHDRLLDARVGALVSAFDASPTAAELLDFWIDHRLAVATLLDHRGRTSRTSYRQAFVDRLVDHVAAGLDAPLGAVERQLLTIVFDNTRRAIATMLRSTDDADDLRALVTGFWSYQLPGLDGLGAWMRQADPSGGRAAAAP